MCAPRQILLERSNQDKFDRAYRTHGKEAKSMPEILDVTERKLLKNI